MDKHIIITLLFLPLVICNMCPKLVTDFSQDTCIDKTKKSSDTSYYYSLDSADCLPSCMEYNQGGEYTCRDAPCPPGYQCLKRCGKGLNTPCETQADCKKYRADCEPQCVDDLGSCMSYWANTMDFRERTFSAKIFKPSCTNEGDWKAKQCKGGSAGRCFCFDKHGKRLFGEVVYAKSKEMTCACSRRKADLLASGRHHVGLHCDKLGNYEPLQCDSDLCWCVEPKTGALTAPVVPMKAMSRLPCYESSKVGSQYYRQCDSVAYALATITYISKLHGVRYPNVGSILCDGDGAFGAYVVKDQKALCTWRDGKQIAPYQTEQLWNLDKLNCNCARDLKMYNHKLKCEGSGNYQPLQSTQSSTYYCVDDDGFAKSETFQESKVNCSTYY